MSEIELCLKLESVIFVTIKNDLFMHFGIYGEACAYPRMIHNMLYYHVNLKVAVLERERDVKVIHKLIR